MLKSYIEGKWFESKAEGEPLFHAVTGDVVAECSSEGIDFGQALEYGRSVGGSSLRDLTFHQRAILLKEVGKFLLDRKDELYETSEATGATKKDSWIDIEGGIGTFFAYSSKARKELPDSKIYLEGATEMLSKGGSFVGQHVCVPLEGIAVHINAFNFPCWGALEKIAPAFLAGVPSIVKPASQTSFLTEHMFQLIVESGIIPEGSLQLICGEPRDILDHVTSQDVVTFTGSASTGKLLRAHPKIVSESVRFTMEADSLNFSMLGEDVTPDMPEFDLFIKEVAREMTVKAGQKCTAIRRTLVPEELVEQVTEALKERLSKISLGDPRDEKVKMGPLATKEQVKEVSSAVKKLQEAGELVLGGDKNFDVIAGDKSRGAFYPSTLLVCSEPFKHSAPHDVEAFGPVNTIMPYSNTSEAISLAKLGKGSLVGSVFSADDDFQKEIVHGCASHHGRLVLINEESSKESTGHGSPMPHMVHGGPGRAGGGEELGGIRGVLHYMQRTALQGSPTTLSKVGGVFLRNAKPTICDEHPFRKHFEDLIVGQCIKTPRRTVTEADIVNFAGISGDYFYAHMDDIAAKESLFEKRVAHGYFVISAAAGLFVDPAPGPVLANYGLEDLRFVEPVYIGDTIQVQLTVKQKSKKHGTDEGVVWWDVEVRNQEETIVAAYTLLTLVRCREA